MCTIHVSLFSRGWQHGDTVDTFESDIMNFRRQLAGIGAHAVVSPALLYSLVISKVAAVPMFSNIATIARGESVDIPEGANVDAIFDAKLRSFFELMRSSAIKEQSMEATAMAAFAARPNFVAKPAAQGLICNYCHKPGHFRKDCPKLKAKTQTKANAAEVPQTVAAECEQQEKSTHKLTQTPSPRQRREQDHSE